MTDERYSTVVILIGCLCIVVGAPIFNQAHARYQLLLVGVLTVCYGIVRELLEDDA